MSRRQVNGIPQTAHLARQLQHDDELIQIFSESSASDASTSSTSPTLVTFVQGKLRQLRSLQEFKHIDAFTPFVHILTAPFVGSLLGHVLGVIARRSSRMDGLLMLAPSSTRGSPAVWYLSGIT